MSLANALPEAVTVDAFFGGRVEAVQPKDGHHRAGLEAVLLAATIDATFAGTVVDLGAGVGVAGFGVAARCPATRVVLVERDGEAIACAEAGLARLANRAFADRVRIVRADISDVESMRAAAGLGTALADLVVMNPPFYPGADGTRSPKSARAAAHVLGESGLDPWVRAATIVLKPGARLVVVFRADRLDALLAGVGQSFGDLAILPIRPREGLPAHRVLLRAALGSREPTRHLAPLTLHGAVGGAYLPEVDRMLRGRIGLAEAHPVWDE